MSLDPVLEVVMQDFMYLSSGSRFFLIMDLEGNNLCFGSASGLLCIWEGRTYGIRHQRPKAKLSPA